MTNDKWEYDLAWQEAWQQRHCPPESILFNKETEQLRHHLDFCPACRETLEIAKNSADKDLYKQFGTILQQTLSGSVKSSIKAGQVWSLKKELGGWGEERRYYTPPHVLVLEDIDEAAVKVAQIHEIRHFTQSDDIALGEGFTGFAEGWNCYTLRKEDLAICWGDIDSTVVDKVNQISNDASKTQKINPSDTLFRQLEIDAGFFFSSRAVSALMDLYETKTEQSKVINLFDKIPTVSIEKAAQEGHFQPPANNIVSLQEYLVRSRPTPDILQQAADSGNVTYCCGPFLTMDNQGNVVMKPVSCHHEQPDYDPADHSMVLLVKFDHLPDHFWEDQTSFGWLLPDDNLIWADDVDLDHEQKRVNIIFSEIPNRQAVENGNLHFCFVDTYFENND